jgi:hypothetical protein
MDRYTDVVAGGLVGISQCDVQSNHELGSTVSMVQVIALVIDHLMERHIEIIHLLTLEIHGM